MRYAKINLFDIANGEGIRVSLFVSGCKFHCDGCFNPEAQQYDYGNEFTNIEQSLILGRLVSNQDFAGLSILGGDPLCQSEKDIQLLADLCDQIHNIGKNVWMWTGYTWEEILQDDNLMNLVKRCDYVIDGRFEKDKKNLSLAWRGSSNQNIIDVKASLEGGKKCVIQKG